MNLIHLLTFAVLFFVLIWIGNSVKQGDKKIMELVEQLKAALNALAGQVQDGFGDVSREIQETADTIDALKQTIADLEQKLGDEPALRAAISEAVEQAGSISDALKSKAVEIETTLDTLQPHPEPPAPEPVPEV